MGSRETEAQFPVENNPIIRIGVHHRTLYNMLISTAQSIFTRVAFGANRPSVKSNFYAVTDRLIDGQVVAMDRFMGNVLVVVNVASK